MACAIVILVCFFLSLTLNTRVQSLGFSDFQEEKRLGLMKKYIWILSVLILAVACLFLGQKFLMGHGAHHKGVEGQLVVHKAYIIEPVASAKSAAGYLTLVNKTGQDDVLVSASGDVSNRIEIHTMKMDGEIMRMRQLQDGLNVPTGATTELQPGGDHLMFMGLNSVLNAGDEHILQLNFENAAPQQISFEIVKRGESPSSSHMDHN